MAANKSGQGGATIFETGVDFAVWSHNAGRIELCLFGDDDKELARLPMQRGDDHVHRLFVDGLKEGARYGYRADGVYAPDSGLWFDPSKLLVDPYAKELDRPFSHDPLLGSFGADTQHLVPKAIVTRDVPVKQIKPLFKPGGFVYEVAVRSFTKLHPDVPEAQRGTVAALTHPSVIAHLKRIGVNAVELMPITAWIDERHLPRLSLRNSWGYNPVAFMALDPRLVPGGMAELRDAVAKLHGEGIAVILDLVFNHTGESDRFGTTLSLRGLDNLSFYRHLPQRPGDLVNDTGTGNTVACDHPYVRQLIIDSLRNFVLGAGIDGFRFDLAPVLGRTASGFEGNGETLTAMLADEVLKDRVMIAEPWDIGPGGYQLGNFPAPFLEWNDRVRDDIRCYWRGDDWKTGPLATALAGSSDIFGRNGGQATRSVNFLAAHDGFTLNDLVSYSGKHNEANGEENRDGHNENHSWNNGVEGESRYPDIIRRRRDDLKALLSTLFASRGSIMLTAGDEGGRTQRGNNNAYCQDNEITWMDWPALDDELVAHTAFISGLRKRFSVFSQTGLLNGNGDVEWISPSGRPMTVQEWETPNFSTLGMVLATRDEQGGKATRLAVLFNRSGGEEVFTLPGSASWRHLAPDAAKKSVASAIVPRRSVAFYLES
ncbi:glycogen debranching protein GlgX [Rhizobium grahamii]|uniref:Glycosyl hydrolase (Glycogen debranching) protein n=1 Tax=Rhizobium grahamii CCGE 502 TaxID=990285 RepID=S3I7G0_9HYPH|nr:glycogen debranching protein GlgX [Rhizobium grahamii]EPE95328.1 glycosyl hydrolase (glycogen debranching) protein [Rhizobium grahamii CCGE 502]